LLARSGMPLFVSIDPNQVGPQQEHALKQAFATAAQPQPVAEPLDWLDTTCPGLWKLGNETVRYHWVGKEGVEPFSPSIPMWWS
jgi:alpha-galactosidase